MANSNAENINVNAAYPVMEHFYTLQGEGAYTGHAAYFIRLGGCDVGCVWCDVKESWPIDQHHLMTIEEIITPIQTIQAPIAVITGGEPTMHHLQPITTALKAAGVRAHIETSATNIISGEWDWITISPKKFQAPLLSELKKADEFKVVVFHPSDLEWAKSFVPNLKDDCRRYLQAEWSKQEEMTPLIIDFIKTHPEWHLSMQTHKYLDIP